MKDSPFNRIVEAIDGHRLLKLVDDAGERIVEPYLIYESAAGDMLVHGWQRGGAGERPSPGWCNVHLDDLVAVELMPGRFATPHPEYNPRWAGFHRVLYEIEPHIRRRDAANEARKVRFMPPRKRPPKAKSPRGGTAARAPRSRRH